MTHALEHGHEDPRDPVDPHAGHAHAAPMPAPPDGAAVAASPFFVAPPPRGLTKAVLTLYERTPAWGAPAAILLCFLSAASYVWISNPTDGGAADIPTCIVKLTTGMDCPGCGGTRAFYYLMHGDLPQAVRYHAVAIFAAPFLVWLYVAWAVRRTTGRKIPVPTIGPRALSVFLGAWAVFAVVRNLPFAPFTSLYV